MRGAGGGQRRDGLADRLAGAVQRRLLDGERPGAPRHAAGGGRPAVRRRSHRPAVRAGRRQRRAAVAARPGGRAGRHRAAQRLLVEPAGVRRRGDRPGRRRGPGGGRAAPERWRRAVARRRFRQLHLVADPDRARRPAAAGGVPLRRGGRIRSDQRRAAVEPSARDAVRAQHLDPGVGRGRAAVRVVGLRPGEPRPAAAVRRRRPDRGGGLVHHPHAPALRQRGAAGRSDRRLERRLRSGSSHRPRRHHRSRAVARALAGAHQPAGRRREADPARRGRPAGARLRFARRLRDPRAGRSARFPGAHRADPRRHHALPAQSPRAGGAAGGRR